MKKLAIAVALVGLVATPVLAAQSAKSVAPGQRMHESGSVKGTTGASGYAPGHMAHKGKHGASAFAPGHKKRMAASRTSGKSTVGMSSHSSTTAGSSTSSKTTVGVSKGSTKSY